jgi:outer membrane protein assembly factor BamD (BamD/ComL family)
MKGKVIFVFWLAVFIQVSTNAQEDFTRQYSNAKALFKEGKYNLAMETFKALIPVSQKNQYSEYATFYYALSAYNLGYKALAKTSLNQIKTLYPAWEKLNEVNFWIGKINLEDKDYFQGMKILDGIQDVTTTSHRNDQTKAISGITDPETLRMLHGNYPDCIVAKTHDLVVKRPDRT